MAVALHVLAYHDDALADCRAAIAYGIDGTK